MTAIAEQWQACLGMEQELSTMEASHGEALDTLRSKWNASLDELETSAATELKDLEANLAAKRKRGSKKKKDPAMMQQLLNALL